MDTLSPSERSERMRRIRSKDSKAELTVRRLVHSMGYRYRLHRRDLPGTPDMVFPSRRKAIFVHGCFWHGHENCGRMPKSRRDFWDAKIRANKERDQRKERELEEMGWSFLVVWECQVRDKTRLETEIRELLDGPEVN